jgi:hypothetical protein
MKKFAHIFLLFFFYFFYNLIIFISSNISAQPWPPPQLLSRCPS